MLSCKGETVCDEFCLISTGTRVVQVLGTLAGWFSLHPQQSRSVTERYVATLVFLYRREGEDPEMYSESERRDKRNGREVITNAIKLGSVDKVLLNHMLLCIDCIQTPSWIYE